MFKQLKKFKKTFLNNETDFHEFRPVLSEIEERPINPLGNFIFWTIIIFIFIAALWMYFGKIDVVVTAQGVVIPNGEEKVVQSLDKGVLTSLKAKEGQYVKQGEVVAIVQPAEYEPTLEINNLNQEEAAIKEELASAKNRLAIAQNDLSRLRTVLDIIPKARYEETLKETITLKHQIGSLRANLAEIQNKKIQIEKKKQILKSPKEGYIGQIFTHTEGGVVNSGEKILTVIPKNAELKIKAKVLNRDIGFIKEGLPVAIKIDTYDFQKYGMLKGKVEIISPNSIGNEHLGEIYEVYITFDKLTLLVEGKEKPVKTGMTTTNEINIGKRRVIEFFIYPLIKYLDESVKVR